MCSSDLDADAADAAALLASDKDREEHAIVVAALRARLAPLTDRLEVAPAPVVLALPHVQHLATTVQGRLRDRSGAIALAELLHPTPAVAGEPLGAASGHHHVGAYGVQHLREAHT